MSMVGGTVEELAPAGPLADWLDANIPELGSGPLKVEKVHGGTSNVILSLDRGEGEMMLRRPPLTPPPNSEKTVMREARVLRALNGTDVPRPHCYGVCPDPGVIGSPFYVMQKVEGWSATIVNEKIIHPAPFGGTPEEPKIIFALVDGLIALANVDYQAVGLEGFGKPDNFLERQVDRWASQLASYKNLYNYEGRDLPGYSYCEGWLREHIPPGFKAGIIHGDVATPNAMFAHEPPARLNALIDWELSTIGDPLIDLAWICGAMRDEREPDRLPAKSMYPAANLPTRQALARHYSAGTGRDVSHLDYYLVLANFKVGCILEYKVAQAAAGMLPEESGKMFSRLVLKSFEEAERLARGI